jgi:hypothetical protein
MSRPDITKAQAAAAVLVGVPLIANLLRAFGVYDMNDQEQHSLTEALTWVVPLAVALVLGDAHLRGKRNEADAHVAASQTVAPAATDDLDVAHALTALADPEHTGPRQVKSHGDTMEPPA